MRTESQPRPGIAVCICESNGRVSLYDPGAWMREQWRKQREAERTRKKEGDRENS